MPLPDFDTLFAAADSLATPVPVVAVGGADATVLEALSVAKRRGWVAPLLAGREADIRQKAEETGVDLTGWRILDDKDAATAAVAAVRAGEARVLMKGQIATPDLMRAVLHQEHGLRTGKTLCQVVLLEVRSGSIVAGGSRRFLLSDTGLCIQPTFRQKSEILETMVDICHKLGVEHPRVAAMAATEKATESMPDTLEAAELTRLGEAGEFAGCSVQGPLSFDLAYAVDAGDKKRIAGSVVGAADAMLFPDLLSANLTVKAIMYTADCRFGGIVCGAACPIVFMSRADSTETRLNSLAYTLQFVSGT